MSKQFISVRTTPDKGVIQTLEDGREVDITPKRPLSAAPASDHQGMSPEELAKLKPRTNSGQVRRALGLTQEEFATRYRIPVGTLRDWEQGRTEPDAPARAYIEAISKNPEIIWRSLAS
jgi:putative transcriptional regulator